MGNYNYNDWLKLLYKEGSGKKCGENKTIFRGSCLLFSPFTISHKGYKKDVQGVS